MGVTTRSFRLTQDAPDALRQIKSGIQGVCATLNNKVILAREIFEAAGVGGVEEASALGEAASELELYLKKIVSIAETIVNTRSASVRLETEFQRALDDVKAKHLGVGYPRSQASRVFT